MPRPRVYLDRCPPEVDCVMGGWHWTCSGCLSGWGMPVFDGPFDSAAEANDEAVLHLREKHRA